MRPIYSDFLYKNSGNRFNITGQEIIRKLDLERNSLFKKNTNNLLHQEKKFKATKSNLDLIKFPKNELERKNNVIAENRFKSNLNSKFKNHFKEINSIYVSPFGKPVDRAPDESLVNCKSKECFE